MANNAMLYSSPMYVGRNRSYEDNALQSQGFQRGRKAMELAKEAELEARTEAALVAEYGPRLKPDSKE